MSRQGTGTRDRNNLLFQGVDANVKLTICLLPGFARLGAIAPGEAVVNAQACSGQCSGEAQGRKRSTEPAPARAVRFFISMQLNVMAVNAVFAVAPLVVPLHDCLDGRSIGAVRRGPTAWAWAHTPKQTAYLPVWL